MRAFSCARLPLSRASRSTRVHTPFVHLDAARARAQAGFEALRARDPCRLEALDIYSNVLYVKEAKAELSHLAHVAFRHGKYRPETCCILGNYYSLKAQHERAVTYFQRALRLDRRFLCAWTLMGHEVRARGRARARRAPALSLSPPLGR